MNDIGYQDDYCAQISLLLHLFTVIYIYYILLHLRPTFTYTLYAFGNKPD